MISKLELGARDRAVIACWAIPHPFELDNRKLRYIILALVIKARWKGDPQWLESVFGKQCERQPQEKSLEPPAQLHEPKRRQLLQKQHVLRCTKQRCWDASRKSTLLSLEY